MDISISRQHCQILLKDDGLIIEDLLSKYGTLIKLTEPFQIQKEKKVKIQIGNSFLCMKYQSKNCCCK